MPLSYHYTTIEKFQKMLENSVDNDGKISTFKFWASSIYSMNDPTEFLYGYDILWNKVVPEIEKEIGIRNDADKLSKLYKRYKSGAEDWKNKIVSALYENHKVPFIVSFSTQKDFLPMWTTYANNGNGICLGFKNEEYNIKGAGKDMSLDIIHQLHVLDVNYDHSDESVENVLLKLYKDEYNKYVVEKDEQRREGMMISAFVVFSITAAPYYKDKAYAYESERRLIIFKNDETDVKYRCNARGRLIPYVEVPVKAEYLSEVIIGPCADFISVQRELLSEFEKFNIKVDKEHIISSCVPYRVY